MHSWYPAPPPRLPFPRRLVGDFGLVYWCIGVFGGVAVGGVDVAAIANWSRTEYVHRSIVHA